MTNILQQAVVLRSQDQLSSAARLGREWAIAHAGTLQSEAHRALSEFGSSGEWQQSGLTIRISQPKCSGIEQGQLIFVRYEPAASAEPYLVYFLTYAFVEPNQPGGRLMLVAAVPDALHDAAIPWDDRAGIPGIDKVVASVSAPLLGQSGLGNPRRPVFGIDDLFRGHDTALVLTQDGQQVKELCELAHAQRDWATVISVDASELVAIGRDLTMEELYALVRAKIALFEKYSDGAGRRLAMAESDPQIADAFLKDARDRAQSKSMFFNAFALMELLESTASATDTVEPDIADVSSKDTGAMTDGEPDLVAAQQRIYILQDQLSEAEQTISELKQRLGHFETYYSEEQVDDPDGTPESDVPRDLDVNRALTVLSSFDDGERYPRLRFLTNSIKPLEDYGKPRPNGVEILQALDAINRLAEAWNNTPSRNIGPWVTYFIDLPGWKYAADETEKTMGLHGEKRSFSDQEVGRQITITRHLTYQGSSGGLQIYFDQDDATDKFMVGYIGEHLSYASSRS